LGGIHKKSKTNGITTYKIINVKTVQYVLPVFFASIEQSINEAEWVLTNIKMSADLLAGMFILVGIINNYGSDNNLIF
jgi:hypothetical protein